MCYWWLSVCVVLCFLPVLGIYFVLFSVVLLLLVSLESLVLFLLLFVPMGLVGFVDYVCSGVCSVVFSIGI